MVTEAAPPQAQTEMAIVWRIMMGERYFIRRICLIHKLLVLSTNLDERRKSIRSVSKWPNASEKKLFLHKQFNYKETKTLITCICYSPFLFFENYISSSSRNGRYLKLFTVYF